MGAFVEPLSVAVHAVKRSRMRVGASVAIVGAGPIGLLVMQACLTAGAGKVFDTFKVSPVISRSSLTVHVSLYSTAAIKHGRSSPVLSISRLTRTRLSFNVVSGRSI